MKIITLNVWGGRLHKELIAFLKERSDVDVFCLQEVYHDAVGKDTIWHGTNLNMLEDIKEALPSYSSFYHPHLEDWWGLALFAKKNIPYREVGEDFVHLHKRHNLEMEVLGHTAKNIQYFKTSQDGKLFSILNFHGLWNGKGKTDTDARVKQSEKIIEFIKGVDGEVVLCGDLNLLPDTQSIKMLEDSGLRNLVREYGIASTRTSLYAKPDKFADYIFVSKGIEVKDFKVIEDEVSDHAPLFIEIA